MGKRVDALLRIWALLWVTALGYALSIVFGTIAFLFMIVDVLWQLVTGSDGLSASGTLASATEASFMWTVGQSVWAFLGGSAGDGGFRWHAWA